MRRHAVAVLLVVVPLALVAQAVRALADAEARPLVVLPLARIRLRHVRVVDVVLADEAQVAAVRVHGRVRQRRLRRVGAHVADVTDRAPDRAARETARRLLDVAGALLLAQFQAESEGLAQTRAALLVEQGAASGRWRLVASCLQHEAASALVDLTVPLLHYAVLLRLAAQRREGRAQGLGAVVRRQAVWHALTDPVAVTHAAQPLALVGS